MSKLSQQVANRIRTAQQVITSYEVHGDKVLRAAAQEVDGLKVGALREVLDASVEHLRLRTHALRDDEHGYTAEQADDHPARAARDTAATDLASVLTELRTVVRGAFGDEAVDRYGLAGRTSEVPATLAEDASNTISLLRQQPARGDTTFGFEVDTAALADQLELRLTTLRDALNQVDREARELTDALLARDAAVDAWSATYPAVAALLEGIYRLAGERELADRIRPTTRRAAGRTDAEVTEPTAEPVADPVE